MKQLTHPQPSNEETQELRLITKAVAFLALITGLLYLRVIVGDALTDMRAGSLPLEAILLFIFLVSAVMGLAVAWRREGVGGLMTLAGGIGLAVIDYTVFDRNGWFAAVLYSSPFIISGVLCLVCWWLRRSR